MWLRRTVPKTKADFNSFRDCCQRTVIGNSAMSDVLYFSAVFTMWDYCDLRRFRVGEMNELRSME